MAGRHTQGELEASVNINPLRSVLKKGVRSRVISRLLLPARGLGYVGSIISNDSFGGRARGES